MLRSGRWAGRLVCGSLLALAVAHAQQPPAVVAPPPRFVAVLDAAHGGDDPGAQLAGNQPEKAVTLALSVRLRSLLGARGIQVLTSREGDSTLAPDTRAALANHANAQLCLILHATESGSGVHLFSSALAPAPAGRFTAWKTAQAAFVTRSLALEGVLNSALHNAGIPVSLGRVGLPGLDSMTCPAVAIELAPQRDADGRVVAEPAAADYQAHVAAALAAAVLEWRGAASTEARQP